MSWSEGQPLGSMVPWSRNSRIVLIWIGMDEVAQLSISYLNKDCGVRRMEINNGTLFLSRIWSAVICGSGWNLLAGAFSVPYSSLKDFQPKSSESGWAYQGERKQWVKDHWFERINSLILYLETKDQKRKWTFLKPYSHVGNHIRTAGTRVLWLLGHRFLPG